MHTKSQIRVGADDARRCPTGRGTAGKDVTRRRNWRWAESGMYLLAVSKCQGVRPGEIVETFGVIQIVDVRREPLNAIDSDDVRREGFGHMTPDEFVAMFCKAMGAKPTTEVARIQFVHVDPTRDEAARRALTPDQARALSIAVECWRCGGTGSRPVRGGGVTCMTCHGDGWLK